MPNTPAPEMEDGIETIIVGKHSLTVGTDYVEISRIGAGMPDRTDETIRIENASVRLYEESGTDITGEGNPDVIVFSSTGGAHCCYTFHVYDMGEYPRKVMEAFTKDCGGEFKDLEGDGVFEFITCDASFNYFTRQCCYACSPFPRVVYRYTPESGYRVA
ncbi:MAG: hypothetical protein OEZ02_02045, partial [Anaerolineae bacterium]|nr:hypothetical protein [Anaerolineae bacterium]